MVWHMDINQILKLGAEVFSQSDLSGEAGSQLDSIGGIEGALNMAGRLFSR